jgi:hypothetical protein
LVSTIREVVTLRVFESRGLQELFGSERGSVTGGRRKLLSEFRDLYSLVDIIRMIR